MKIPYIFYLMIVIAIFSTVSNACSDEVYLKSGDKITGEIVEQKQDSISVKTEAMGSVSIKRDHIDRIVKEKEEPPELTEKPKKAAWQGEVSLGYDRTTGNTRDNQISGSFLMSRNNKHVDEWTLGGNLYYSSTNRKMDAQKWYGMGRYAFSLGESKKWYSFFRGEADHDRFADIDYRLVPAAGVGYWLYDLPGIKLMAEVGAGLDHTVYKSKIKDRDEWVLTPRLFLEKKLFNNSKITQNLYYYPTIEDYNDYRLRSDTSLDIALNKKLSLRLSLIDDYNSVPSEDTKKNDLRLISSLVCSF